jgi:hypothetical protein
MVLGLPSVILGSSAHDTALCIAHTFERSGEVLKPYNNAQLNRGLNYIISNGLSDTFASA